MGEHHVEFRYSDLAEHSSLPTTTPQSIQREPIDMINSLFRGVSRHILLLATAMIGIGGTAVAAGGDSSLASLEGKQFSVQANADGTYSILAAGISGTVIRSDVEAVIDSVVVRSTAYPTHQVAKSDFHADTGDGATLTITHSGLQGQPDLVCALTVMRDRSWGEIAVTVRNTTHRTFTVQSIRSIHATAINLGAPDSAYRILSDSFSEDRPQLAIRDLGAGKGVHRAAGSQLIYNRNGGESLFLGALTSERLLTLFHLHEKGTGESARVASYDVDATGTTEILKEESLKHSPAAEQVTLSLPVNPGEALGSERLMFSIGTDYHGQLEEYGRMVRELHHARVSAPTPIGWWSWTAYYFGVNQGSMATNADWLAQNLKQLGYTYFQIDEGYQYARGEYMSADASRFPQGVAHIADEVRHDGLTFGLWTAPFEVSERAWVYQNHKDWLIHNAAGVLIHIGHVTEKRDPLYVLDTTNPGAQEYLRQTYTTLRDWGVRFIKMDFMDDTAIEGSYFRPNTTAMEAQRMGLEIIRKAVGDDVVLDKDGSPMLNPVGLVDAGRISQDTGHTFEATRDAASGVAARYYMNRNFFISDPDAFTVSTQTVDDQSWHGGQRPLTLDEAQVSIALSAVSGGMFEIGDDLPTLGTSKERLSLVKNPDLLDMAKLGRASTPQDLMTYAPSDQQPSVFLLKESPSQAILTVFNWTEATRTHSVNLAELGLKEASTYRLVDVFGSQDCCQLNGGVLRLEQKPHSVRMIKIIDTAASAVSPSVELRAPATGAAGHALKFKLMTESPETPILSTHWDFGDGISGEGTVVSHTYTHAGEYEITVTSTGLNSVAVSKTVKVSISGEIPTLFDPSKIQRADH
jgi:alpha-galactosidase